MPKSTLTKQEINELALRLTLDQPTRIKRLDTNELSDLLEAIENGLFIETDELKESLHEEIEKRQNKVLDLITPDKTFLSCMFNTEDRNIVVSKLTEVFFRIISATTIASEGYDDPIAYLDPNDFPVTSNKSTKELIAELVETIGLEVTFEQLNRCINTNVSLGKIDFDRRDDEISSILSILLLEAMEGWSNEFNKSVVIDRLMNSGVNLNTDELKKAGFVERNFSFVNPKYKEYNQIDFFETTSQTSEYHSSNRFHIESDIPDDSDKLNEQVEKMGDLSNRISGLSRTIGNIDEKEVSYLSRSAQTELALSIKTDHLSDETLRNGFTELTETDMKFIEALKALDLTDVDPLVVTVGRYYLENKAKF